MIDFEKAYALAMGAARPLGHEEVPLDACSGRILAQEVRADMAMPPFDKAIVDGYAARREDLPGPLRVVETVAAGYAPQRSVGAGECVKIMTGAMVPEGVDCVFMVEYSEEDSEGSVRFTGAETNRNISSKGTDIVEGDLVLSPGHRILPMDVAILGSMGCARVRVAKQPRVAIVATGDELVEPEAKPSPVQIRNSNAYQLCAQARQITSEAVYAGIARDNEDSLREKIGAALSRCDVLIMSGGVSMGEFDIVPDMLKEFGIKILFGKVAVQPGKPTVFGHSEEAYCFGLPGNPVATFVVFELMVKPFLYKLMGHDYTTPAINLPLEEAISRKNDARLAWIPVVLTDEGTVSRVAYHGSAHLSSLSHAHGLVAFPRGERELAKGTSVRVRLIRY